VASEAELEGIKQPLLHKALSAASEEAVEAAEARVWEEMEALVEVGVGATTLMIIVALVA
jgi:hypothetical protein